MVLGKLLAIVKRCDFEDLGEIQKYPVRNGLTALHGHRRMRWGRTILRKTWNAFFRVTPFEYRPPIWYSYKKSPAAIESEERAVASFLGSLHPDDRVVRWHKEQFRLHLLDSRRLRPEDKDALRAEGPRCSPSDIAHMEWLQGYAERCSDPEYVAMLEAGGPACRPDDLAYREYLKQLHETPPQKLPKLLNPAALRL